MRLTTRSEYALMALVHLARRDPASFVSAKEIAAARSIPLPYLSQILRVLQQGRYVRSAKGQHGGFRLARHADRVSIAEIVRLFDGALAPTRCVSRYFYDSSPIEGEQKIVALFREIRDFIAKKLEKTTIADVA